MAVIARSSTPCSQPLVRSSLTLVDHNEKQKIKRNKREINKKIIIFLENYERK